MKAVHSSSTESGSTRTWRKVRAVTAHLRRLAAASLMRSSPASPDGRKYREEIVAAEKEPAAEAESSQRDRWPLSSTFSPLSPLPSFSRGFRTKAAGVGQAPIRCGGSWVIFDRATNRLKVALVPNILP